MDANLPFLDNEWAAPVPRPALAVSCTCSQGDPRDQLAREAYSYRLVYESFAPLLQRWGTVREVHQPESRLDHALYELRRQGNEPLHLSFMPLHLAYLTGQAPNVAFPFWEFPDIPERDLGGNPRNNWKRIADRLALLLTACTFTRDAFQRSGVRTPIAVVPVPIREEYFSVPQWAFGQRMVIDCPAYVFPQPDAAVEPPADPDVRTPDEPFTTTNRMRRWYRNYVRPCIPTALARGLSRLARAGAAPPTAATDVQECPVPNSPVLELSGVVWTAIFNPYDARKNWTNLLTAYLHALRDEADATLVLKLVVSRDLAERAVAGVIGFYRDLGFAHRCKLAIVTEYLSSAQMVELAQASTYHVNASRAEGANLPLQDFMAAGRPGISPCHTAMRDYFHDELGLVVASHAEPSRWPHDPEQSLTTSWHDPVWESLRDQLRASYELAKHRGRQYQVLAARSREQIEDFAGAERVWPRLATALNAAITGRRPAAPERDSLRHRDQRIMADAEKERVIAAQARDG
jgi:hypothetical protein